MPRLATEKKHSALRFGIVAQQDVANCRVRVTFADLDRMLSYWLPIGVRNSQNNKDFWMPDLGEQVACLMDDRDEAGVVLASVYSTADATPAGASKDQAIRNFSDGASFKYDRSSHAATIALPGGATLTLSIGGAQKLVIDSSGNLTLENGTANIALVGGQVTCPAGTGTIVAAGNSTKVKSA